MINFNEHRGKQSKILTDVFEIYNNLDRSSNIGELRQVQKEILEKWTKSYKDKKDTILKLHTGEGKTLLGLLILQSTINEFSEPCIYLCPNNHLVHQTCQQAKKFGIPFVVSDGELPDEFINGEKILITSCQKMFNGRTKFGLGAASIDIKGIVLDDSHLCVDIIEKQFKLILEREKFSDFFDFIIDLFEGALKEQGSGTLLDIREGEYDSIMSVPYWSWFAKHDDVREMIATLKQNTEVMFAWPILKNLIDKCSCVISGKSIEIVSDVIDLSIFGSYYNCDRRIMMSATVSDDSVLVNSLNIEADAIENPLVSDMKKWSGEKMLLCPEAISNILNRDTIMGLLNNQKLPFGRAVLTPSFAIAEKWRTDSSIVVESDTITSVLNHHYNDNYRNTLVFANRYDGIDLPDAACRILVVDQMPMGDSNYDRYLEYTIPNSSIIRKKQAMKLEQAFGRSVRGEKDYSAVIILGSEVNKFMKSNKTRHFFSKQTLMQIDIGQNIVTFAKKALKNDSLSSIDIFRDVVNQLLSRDSGWKGYYEEQMNLIDFDTCISTDLEVYQQEKEAERLYMLGEYSKASNIILSVAEDYFKDDQSMKGYYLQKAAKYIYATDKAESINLQKGAYNQNSYLLKPNIEIKLKKKEIKNKKRIELICDYLRNFENHVQLMLNVASNVELLSYGTSSEKFERTLQEIGTSLGFTSERPDKTYKDGPDNIWIISSRDIILFESKNQVKTSRQEIYKHEAGQMNNHCGWFFKEFKNYNLHPRLIINTTVLGTGAHFNEDVKIVTKTKLELFKSKYFAFFNSFRNYELDELTDKIINDKLNEFSLSNDDLLRSYYDEVTNY